MSDRVDFDRTDRPSTAQPPPISRPGLASVHDLVIADIEERKKFGHDKYGTYLTVNNGRDPLMDAYEEVLDLAAYLRQLIAERTKDIKDYLEPNKTS